MSSQRQIEANQKNSRLSTGPKSAKGKGIVALNAMKHGVFSKQILLQGESEKEFETLKKEFYRQFQPQGLLEQLFCERALAAAWRLSRITQMESMLITQAANKVYSGGMIGVLNGYEGDGLALLSRYEISLEKILFRSLAELRELQSVRKREELRIGFVPQNFIEDLPQES